MPLTMTLEVAPVEDRRSSSPAVSPEHDLRHNVAQVPEHYTDRSAGQSLGFHEEIFSCSEAQ